MRRFHANWEPQVSGFVLRECVNEDCTMDHVVSMSVEAERRLALVLALVNTPPGVAP